MLHDGTGGFRVEDLKYTCFPHSNVQDANQTPLWTGQR